ncbi:MAG: hypothetical protein ABH851_01665 [Methanobacteriota archaeon]
MKCKSNILCIALALFLISAYNTSAFDLPELKQELALKMEFELEDYSGNVSFQAHVFVVKGSDVDFIEQVVYDTLSSATFQADAELKVQSESQVIAQVNETIVHFVPDSPQTLREIRSVPSTVILVGGAEHNNLSAFFLSNASVKDVRQQAYDQLNVTHAVKDGVDLIVIEHPRTKKALEHVSAKTSPLARFVPEAYVPAAAAASGIGLIWIVNLLQTVFEFKALTFGRKKRELRKTTRKIGPIHVEDALAVLGASFVLGLSITFTFFGFTEVFARKLIQNWMLCFFAAISHEVSHRLIGRMFNIHIEYHFWWTGSLITLVTGYLGHPFSIQGFLMEKVEGNISKWKYGLTKLAAPLFSMVIMLVFAYINFKNPMEVYQIIYTTAGMWAAAEILPFKHLDGLDVRKWSRLIWLVCFIVVFGSFVAVNFVV